MFFCLLFFAATLIIHSKLRKKNSGGNTAGNNRTKVNPRTHTHREKKGMYSHKFPFKPVLEHFFFISISISIFTLFVLYFGVRFWAMCVLFFLFFSLCYCFCGCYCYFAFCIYDSEHPINGWKEAAAASSSSYTHYYFYWIKKPYLRA